jgi:hypothetical protein
MTCPSTPSPIPGAAAHGTPSRASSSLLLQEWVSVRPLVTAGELTLVSARKGPAQPLARGGCPARMRPRQSDGRFVTYTGFLMALANTTVTA